jgi:hypothetical protein
MQTRRMLAETLILMLATTVAHAQAPAPLSSAQQQRIAHAVQSLKSPAERRLAMRWSDAKQVAEWLCRPAAYRQLQKAHPGVERVFLGLGGKHDLRLIGNRELTGVGEARTADGWKTFSFTCELDPQSGNVVKFAEKIEP